MDEPLAVAAAMIFFESLPGTMGLETFISDLLQDFTSPARGAAFENATMIILAQMLNGTRTLEDVLDFHIRDGIPEMWFGRKVQLVAIQGWSGDVPIVCDAGIRKGSSPSLGFQANSPHDVERWSKGSRIAFLLPDDHMGPDVWALVKIGDAYAWFALQDKCLKQARLPPCQLKQAIRTVTDTQYYRDKNNEAYASKKFPDLLDKVKDWMHNLPVLRVLATFPTVVRDVDVQQIKAEVPKHQPLASLKSPLRLLPDSSELFETLTLLRKQLLGESGEN